MLYSILPMTRKIVVKVGTNTISSADGKINKEVMFRIVEQIAQLKKLDYQVILVSSGAVGAGKSVLKLEAEGLPEKQVYAAIGQAHLINLYSELLSPHELICAQVLATRLDFQDQNHKVNMQNCLDHLLHDDILPIINENDVVAVEELIFTDNDELAGLVANLLKVETVIFMTSVDGVLDEQENVIAKIEIPDAEYVVNSITDSMSAGGKGGMVAKFAIAKQLALAGIRVVIVNGKTQNILSNAISDENVGTRITVK